MTDQQANRQVWLVLDQESGAQDGFYTHRCDAEGVRERLAEQYAGRWLVVSVDTRRNPRCRIPDHMFWTQRLPTALPPRTAADAVQGGR